MLAIPSFFLPEPIVQATRPLLEASNLQKTNWIEKRKFCSQACCSYTCRFYDVTPIYNHGCQSSIFRTTSRQRAKWKFLLGEKVNLYDDRLSVEEHSNGAFGAVVQVLKDNALEMRQRSLELTKSRFPAIKVVTMSGPHWQPTKITRMFSKLVFQMHCRKSARNSRRMQSFGKVLSSRIVIQSTIRFSWYSICSRQFSRP
jgi:hypothetical protein